jgi:hypothetical protein
MLTNGGEARVLGENSPLALALPTEADSDHDFAVAIIHRKVTAKIHSEIDSLRLSD